MFQYNTACLPSYIFLDDAAYFYLLYAIEPDLESLDVLLIHRHLLYRTETRTDSEGNTYTVQVPYTYYICNVKLENFDMSHLPVYIMGEEQMSLYAVYMHTLGNRPDLFPNGTYPNASTVKEPTYYDIPPEALEDATFAAMMAEAESM